MNLGQFNQLPATEAEPLLRNCCAAETWVQGMLNARPFIDRDSLYAACRQLWPQLTEADWLQAFEAHPRIGNLDSLRKKYASTRTLAGDEQAGTRQADEDTLQRLSTGNQAYLDKFGFIFIVCATGKSAPEMLELLEQRLCNTRAEELQNAAQEQAKITELRLEKLL